MRIPSLKAGQKTSPNQTLQAAAKPTGDAAYEERLARLWYFNKLNKQCVWELAEMNQPYDLSTQVRQFKRSVYLKLSWGEHNQLRMTIKR
ncbi:hypothetical protein GCM10025791_43280 [Halioxenophilus aromaticivorans]|uniref:Uncharacterized protein n=2 Tax=Halioxenophilus aromaticivorans TaxID=1306992 RepID=A0AAV3U8J5_9ALTE